MSKIRQQRHSEELRKQILEITRTIILNEGINAVSIRRVANELDYTAPIIYHYFQDKTQLLSCAVQDGYAKLLNSITLPDPGLPPDKKLCAMFTNFLADALAAPHVYRSFILNYSSALLAESSVFGPSGHEESPTLAGLIPILEEGVSLGLFAPCDVPLTAKAWWSATFGLFARLMVEPDLPEEEREALIRRTLGIMLKGISA